MALLALLLIVALALMVVRIGATALMMTGISRDVAEFQSISCFFGVGFTTAEAEMIVGHPTRRRIAQHLIIAGNIGLTGALTTVIISFIQDEPDLLDNLIPFEGPNAVFFKLGSILVGILFVGGIFRLGVVKRVLELIIKKSLQRFQSVRAIDYETVLRSSDGYAVMQVEIEYGHHMIGRTLAGVMLGSKGVLVLGIKRKTGQYIGAPHSTTDILDGDMLTVYGQEDSIIHALDPEENPGGLTRSH